MKRLITLAVILLVAACTQNQQKQIENSAYNYLDALGNYRIDDARPYASEATKRATLDFFAKMMEVLDTNYIRKNTPAKVVIKKVVMIDDTTAKAYFTKTTPITFQDDSLSLIKENGQWVADVVINAPNMEKRRLPMPLDGYEKHEIKKGE